MKKYLVLLISIVALFIYNISCNSADASKTVELKFNLPKGAKYEYSATTGMTVKQKADAQDVNGKNEIGIVYIFQGLSDSANWKTLEATISKISMDMNVMGRTLHFDTEMEMDTTRNPLAMMGKMFGALKGAKFSFAVNENGEIGNISGIKEMTEKMFGGLPIPPEALNKSGLNDEDLRNNMEQAFLVYPGKPVKPGDSWTKTHEQSMQGIKLKTENTFTLESVSGNDAVIKQDSKLTSDSSKANAQGEYVSGTTKGTLHYDLSTGMVTDSDQDIKMEMKNTMSPNQKPVTLNMKVKMRGKKI
jgi:uncharacterized protein DUF6263